MVDVKIVNESKVFWKSKTFQIAALGVVAGVITSIAGDLTNGIPITGMSILMMVMRSITKSSVGLSEVKKD